MRIVRSLLAFAFVLIGAAAVAVVLALYLAATGRSLPVLRAVVARLGQTIAGQQTTALALHVRLRPDAGALSGTAQLTVRAAGAGRERVYFLLNDGLRLDAVWEIGADGARAPLPFYRLLMLTVVELPRALDADEEVQLGFAYGGRPRSGGLTASGGVLQPDDVVITPAEFWYPADLQGFFDVDVEVTLPADLTLVHNGREASRIVEGTSARVRWASERPVAGLSLVAGRYTAHTRQHDGIGYRVLLPAGVDLDAERLLDGLAVSQQGLATHFGPSGFAQTTLYVNRHLPRAFNDGTGLLAIPPRYFRDGDYGYEATAHEVAHNWWGATVAEYWLQPGTGGQWIVEGFAELSGWRAVRERLGEAALLRILAASGYDPDSTATLAAQSVLDNGLDREARPIIYDKGGYVAYMLEQRLGSEAFDAAARQFLEQFRHRGATDTDLETVFAASSQQDLAPFFTAWV
ncbi:MAG: M1 family metallopeptidase, partial [Candidatus Binatia bacterium]